MRYPVLSLVAMSVIAALATVGCDKSKDADAAQAQAAAMQMHFEHQEINSLTGEVSADPDTTTDNQTRANRGGSVNYQFSAPVVLSTSGATDANHETDAVQNPYAGLPISRNAPCPCGSGLKYKQCHGKIA